MKKKIAIVSSIYAQSHSPWSGLGRHTFYLAYSLARRNYDVTVFTFAPGGKSFKSQDGQVSLTRIGVASGEGTSLPIEALEEWNAKVFAEMKKQNFEVVLLPTCHGWLSAKASGCKVIGFVPFVYSFTGWTTSVGTEAKKKLLAIEQDFLENCDALICHNEQFAARLSQHAYKTVHILPNCHLDLSEDTVLSQEKVPNSILYVGKINKEKSIETIIRALAFVPKAVLTLSYPENSIHYIPKIMKLASQLNVANRVVCKGWLPSNELKHLYASSEISATTSFHEPYGYVALDPMAIGSIPLVSDWSGLVEYVTPDETFSSIQSMSDKMLNIFSKTASCKKEMLEKNFIKVRTTYSENQSTDTLEQIMRGDV